MNEAQAAASRIVASETKPSIERAYELKQLVRSLGITGTLPSLISAYAEAEAEAQKRKSEADDASSTARTAWSAVRKRAEEGPDLVDLSIEALEADQGNDEAALRELRCPERLIAEGATLRVVEYLRSQEFGKTQLDAYWKGFLARWDGKDLEAANTYKKKGLSDICSIGHKHAPVGPHVPQVEEEPAEDEQAKAAEDDLEMQARCQDEGLAAAHRGALRESPYDADSAEDEAWLSGYDQGAVDILQNPPEELNVDDQREEDELVHRCRKEGYDAVLATGTTGDHVDCPYEDGSWEEKSWAAGMQDACDEQDQGYAHFRVKLLPIPDDATTAFCHGYLAAVQSVAAVGDDPDQDAETAREQFAASGSNERSRALVRGVVAALRGKEERNPYVKRHCRESWDHGYEVVRMAKRVGAWIDEPIGDDDNPFAAEASQLGKAGS